MKAPKGGRMEAGIDLGSTTAKISILDSSGKVLFSDYRRHNAQVVETLRDLVKRSVEVLGDAEATVALTGSAGMGVAERYGLQFVQEVIASIETVKRFHPDVRTILDVGGEDSKMVFLDEHLRPDMRMNGNCAGGTGAFIDQMATLLGVEIADLETLVRKAGKRHPMASRCGVFAKTDVQSLLSRRVPKEEIAASVYHAVAVQTISTLSRGFDPRPKVMFCGGPLAFLPELRNAYMEVLGITEMELAMPDDPHLVASRGAALLSKEEAVPMRLSLLVERLSEEGGRPASESTTLRPLFKDEQGYLAWSETRMSKVERVLSLSEHTGLDCFIGIDSGSTTSKMVVIDSAGKMLYSCYNSNAGDPLGAVRGGLGKLCREMDEAGLELKIAKVAVTGYGEDLMRAAFSADMGTVETLSHFRAAVDFLPDVSFILDIGGQDMKAMRVRNGAIEDIVINEACSSGCGSFLETFSAGLGMGVAEFAQAACRSRAPCDLGTRCTVFMNSKVKQALREGASVEDISAGLAYSVAKNCFYKVLKVKDLGSFGKKIVVQGGTFKNPAVQRAFEVLLDTKVVCPEIPELMGAYGAALLAKDSYESGEKEPSTFIGLRSLSLSEPIERREVNCRGCTNNCLVTSLSFGPGRAFFTGNRCERFFHNKGSEMKKGENLVEEKLKLLFDRSTSTVKRPLLKMGVPRVLTMYDDYPFWHRLLTDCGIEVVLSPYSTQDILELGSKNVMSENICLPAKLVSGHIKTLAKMGVDRIFLPMVVFDEADHAKALNTFMCPIVTGYPDVVRSSVDPEASLKLPFDSPPVSFRDRGLLKKACIRYLTGLGMGKDVVEKAFWSAVTAQEEYMTALRSGAERILKASEKDGCPVVMLAGRPYQLDPLVSRGIAEMASDLGAHVITEDSIPYLPDGLDDVHVLTQWAYPNRLYNAARWSTERDNVEFVQLNSFGCGPDALVVDEARSILHSKGKHHTCVRIDEVSSKGSIRLRLRSMLGSEPARGGFGKMAPVERTTTPPFMPADASRKILVPFFSRFYSPFIEAALRSFGFDVDTLPEPDRGSVEAGLRYCNNEICYPAIIVIGDLIKAIEEGRYDPEKVALGITQTGGQCRATSYLSLLKKGLVTSGYGNIPVVTMNLGGRDINEQPGLKYNFIRIGMRFAHGLLFGDSISLMYYSTAPRELEKGRSSALAKEYLDNGVKLVVDGRESELTGLLRKAVADFNAVPVRSGPLPTVGLVGEIYIKYNPFGSYNIADWLVENGVEVVVPPIFDFFAQDFLNQRFHVKNLTKRPNWRYFASFPEEWVFNYYLDRYEKVRKDFRFYRRAHDVGHLSDLASPHISMVDQFGEGWLIAAESAAFAKDGITNVVCLQPFGCISNHIIGKGIEKAIKRGFPELNMLFLDADAGSSEVNLHNRLSFVLRAAREDLARSTVMKDLSNTSAPIS